MPILFEFLRWLPQYFFPKMCYGCGAEGSFVCDACRPTVKRSLDSPICPACQRPSPKGYPHPSCRTRYGLDRLVTYYRYSGWARDILKAAKFKDHHYRAMVELAKEFALVCQKKGILRGESPHAWTIVPIPLHWFRELNRGFNQSHFIAYALSRIWGIPTNQRLIKRVRYTQPQTLLGAASESTGRNQVVKQRRENVHSAFQLRPGISVPKAIMLVDDVWTTGSTMRECCRTLKLAGVKTVWGITLLRA